MSSETRRTLPASATVAHASTSEDSNNNGYANAEAESNKQQDEETPKNRPNASRFQQQKLPAWQPILTAKTAIVTICAIGVAFIPIGVTILLATNSGFPEFVFKHIYKDSFKTHL